MMPGRTLIRALAATIAVATAAIGFLPDRAAGHEIPADVTVVALVKPDGDRLRLLVRVPLVSIRDIEFPLRGPGYLDLEAAAPLLPEAAKLWIADYLTLWEEGDPLGEERIAATRISLPSDPSFAAWSSALAHVTGPPLPADTEIPWDQAMLDVLLELPIASDASRFSIAPAWAHLGLRTVTVLRFFSADGRERVFRYEGDPGVVRLDPRWHQAALLFTRSGFLHILEGIDHLLFLLCLVIPFRRFGGLVQIVTAFTAAHTITLVASAAGFAPSTLWFPPLIETLIALSIVYMAFENIVAGATQRPRAAPAFWSWRHPRKHGDGDGDGDGEGHRGGDGDGNGYSGGDGDRDFGERGLRRRWLVAFGFGLVHGFGFSFLLRDTLQFAGSHLALSLLSFNLGVELGQLAVLIVIVPVLNWLFSRVVQERVGTILLSALVAHTAWHWMTARGSELLLYDFRWPAFDALLLAAVMHWLMLLLIAVGVVWLLSLLFGAWSRRAARGDAAVGVRAERTIS